jgi:putative RNA 2'-phosphotransferase
MNTSKISKYFSYILRHHPEEIGIKMDKQGWVLIKDLINKTKDFNLTYEIVEKVVQTDNKNRYSISENKKRIRANQGHSVKVNLGLKEKKPPKVLYHGTAERFLKQILLEGLKSMNRHDVHLSENKKTAIEVGKRYGKPILLKIKSEEMHQEGISFCETDNNVWLTKYVKPKYIEVAK